MEVTTIVEVEPMEEIIEINDFCPSKCMFFNIDGKNYLCVVHKNLVLEAK